MIRIFPSRSTVFLPCAGQVCLDGLSEAQQAASFFSERDGGRDDIFKRPADPVSIALP
jgi:hypothetical protein